MEGVQGFFQELFAYSHAQNAELIRVFSENENVLPHFSVRIFNHILNAHCIWNHRMLYRSHDLDVWQIHDTEALDTLNNENFKCSTAILESGDLDEMIDYINSKQVNYRRTVKDILFHIVNHSTYHRGQIAMDFRQHGLEPLVSDYIFYKKNF